MPSDRQLIESDKAYLRRKYPASTTEIAAASLVELKALADAIHEGDPSDVTITSMNFEGGSGGGQLTHRREIRRIALEELIAERDSTYVAPPPRLGDRPYGVTVRLGC